MDTNPTLPLPPPPAPVPNGKAPEKYIRTFANDMSIFQKGGTPGLAPLRAPEPAERLVGPSPIAAAPEPVTVLPTEPPISLSAAASISAAPSPLKTYSGDFRARVQETQASTATVLAAEQDAAAPRTAPAAAETPRKDARNRWYVAGGVFLLVVGGVGIYIAYSQYLVTTAPVVVAPAAVAPIFVDSQEQVSGTGTALMQAIEQSVGKPLALNTVRLLAYDQSAAGISVFSSLDTNAPGILTRNIDASRSMAGVVNTASGQSPFFILSVGSYSATFSGMLSWELAMQSDLGVLYPSYPAPVTATSTATSTRSATAAAPGQQIGFRDEVVSNHDVRIYRDSAGRSILLYGYWNQTTLVIARDPAAFAEILGRLATSHS
ncbi:MAG TPA: hypothetical protein VMV62_02040 [Candidatus Paceibacterota bacterium]|nr:hypothetical protein [Candidatus Paceibacterota bacterium]